MAKKLDPSPGRRSGLDEAPPPPVTTTAEADLADEAVVGAPAPLAGIASGSEFDVEARSQLRMAMRRFVRHKAAMAALVVLAAILVASLLGGVIAPYGYDELTGDFSQGPSLDHLMGTDALGHDLFSQVLRGAQKSVQVALLVALISTLIGVTLGSLAGYYRGWVDAVIARIADIMLTVPLLAILLVAANRLRNVRGNWVLIALLLAVVIWPTIARVVRGVFLSMREREFVEAARASGASSGRIIFRHILPNAVGPIIVNATLIVASAIIIEAALSFLGFGVSPPDTSLGKLVSDGQGAASTRPWLFYFPGLVLLAICLCVNFVGDGLRDAFDPQQNRVRD